MRDGRGRFSRGLLYCGADSCPGPHAEVVGRLWNAWTALSSSGSFSCGGLRVGLGDTIKQNGRRQDTESETWLSSALAFGIRRIWNYRQPFRAVQSTPLAGYTWSPGRPDIWSLELPHRVCGIDSTLLLADSGDGRHGPWQGRVLPGAGRSHVAAVSALQAPSATFLIGGRPHPLDSCELVQTLFYCDFLEAHV